MTTLAALVGMVGCTLPEGRPSEAGATDPHTHSDDTATHSDTDTDTDTGAEHALEIVWTKSSVIVTTSESVGPMKLGMMTGPKDPWEAEDCIGGMTAGFGPFCHTVGWKAETIFPCVKNAADVTDDTTFFCHYVTDGDDSAITYYIATLDDAWCAVFGPNKEHYRPVGCEEW